MSQSHFFAHLSRLKLINRWPLMRNVRTENVSEHSLQVAMVAHALAAIKNRKFGGQVNAERIALLAMYHGRLGSTNWRPPYSGEIFQLPDCPGI
ncbi:Nucleotidase YfbR [Klebsiella pneumoniae]|nr:Nucleotidase YfbR [Klebsiella pneumoniae]